jgi:Xaa-His dipeptidase
MENRKAVVLQAHIDMVPQANADTQHDFTTDPIDAYIDGEWVTARGTTLGADNGMGMAGCLAVLADKTIKHGPLEVLLTTDEETGMTGAFGLEAGWLEGEILLNTDSEEDGEVYMGCAGGVDANIRFPWSWSLPPRVKVSSCRSRPARRPLRGRHPSRPRQRQQAAGPSAQGRRTAGGAPWRSQRRHPAQRHPPRGPCQPAGARRQRG